MTYASLFAGIGGFDLALNRLGHEAVYVNEWDRYCVRIYEKNFKHRPDDRDITIVPESDIPAHDLLVGGFPCQAFSIAGKRRGFDEARGTLFFDVARILAHHHTRYFILENVKGLLSHDNGRTFRVIIKTLTELGYDLQWQVLNSRHFGVPHNRERVFIVGHLRGTPRPQVFPLIPSTETTSGRSDDQRVWHENMSKSLTPRNTASSLRSGASYNYQVVDLVRRLTPVECERLQGFPDNWTAGVSDAQRYKQLGNAVTVNVVYEIVKHITSS